MNTMHDPGCPAHHGAGGWVPSGAATPGGVVVSRRPATMLICIVLSLMGPTATAAATDATDWLARFETIEALQDKSTEAVKFLEGLPLAVRETSDYQWAAARAYLAAGRFKHAAAAVATAGLLVPSPPRDFKAIREKLAERADAFLKEALAALHRKDEVKAVECYSNAVFCDQAVLGRQDEGLGETTMSALERKMRTPTDRADRWFILGFYNFHFSHLQAALEAFKVYLDRTKDPYEEWHARLWIARTQAEMAAQIAAEKAFAAREQRAEADREAAEEADRQEAARRAQEEKPTAQELQAQRMEELIRRQGLETQLRETERQLKEANGRRFGRIVILPNGSYGISAYNQREVKREIQELEAREEEIKSQLDETP